MGLHARHPGFEPPPQPTPQEREELNRLEQIYEEELIAMRIQEFKGMSAAAREEVIKNEELLHFYQQAAWNRPRVGSRLQELWDKRDVTPIDARYDMGYPNNFLKNNVPPSIHVPLDQLRRAHLDACAEDMITR